MRRFTLILLALLMTASETASIATADDSAAVIERGRYLIAIGGCNDCHTPGYPEAGGQVDESDWLVGVPIGFTGPWGTSYAANLRIVADRMTESQFMARARSQLIPPMPWFSLTAMTDDDLAAVYRFIRYLGPAGESMPAYVVPGDKPKTPYFVFVPQTDDEQPVAANQ